MQAKSYHQSTCRLCESLNVEIVVELAPIPLAEKYVTEEQLGQAPELYPVDLYLCGDCGHVQILDIIDPRLLCREYTDHSGQPGVLSNILKTNQLKSITQINLDWH